MINENIAQGKWKELKGNIQKAWGKLTDDELDQSAGDMSRITGLIQQRYGLKQEEVRKKLNDLVGKFGSTEKSDEYKQRH